MIELNGVTLRVKKIRNSKNGDFCVADLSSEVGEFKVKDPMLDQFNDGEYTGTVWISEIYLAQYVAWGKGVTEIRARLHDLQLDGMEELQHHAEMEPDPADELPPIRPAPVETVEAPAPEQGIASLKERLASIGKKKRKGAAQSANDDAAPATDDNDLAALFGDLWNAVQQREPLKLDATVERIQLRQQTAALCKLGYEFAPLKQTWFPK